MGTQSFMSNSESLSKKELLAHLNQQTAKTNWQELERFFAQGSLFVVSHGVDLLDVAAAIIQDDAQTISQLLEKNQLKKVNEEQAITWQKNLIDLWTVVAAPYVLVQVVSA